jgi:tryptophanyl-tRNA synthetase
MKVVFSGVAPSGTIHIGNYLGAIKNWVELQKENQCIFCVVDLHAITTPQEPEKLRAKIMEVAAIYLAAGIDPEKSIVFIQSHNQDHTELAWILNTIAKLAELERMTQFKDKTGIINIKNINNIIDEFNEIRMKTNNSIKALDNFVIEYNKSGKKDNPIDDMVFRAKSIPFLWDIYLGEAESGRKFRNIYDTKGIIEKKFQKASVGLFDYPILMASDILLYNTDIVPVGEDQKQHVELARTLSRRFNQQFGETFKIPQAMIRKEGARIMGLDDPTQKMSKSAQSPANYIALTDKPEIIRDKIKKAVTDSGAEIKFDSKNKPAISNLLTIFALVTNKSVEQLLKEYAGHTSYADFKKDLAEEIIKFLTPFQKKYDDLMAKPEYMKEILDKGAEKSKKISQKTLLAVKSKIGLI